MASLATVSQGQQRAYNSVIYPAWEQQGRVSSPWSDYRSDGNENGLLSEKKDYVADEEIVSKRQHVRFLNSDENVRIADFEAYLDDPQDSYQEGFLEKLRQLRMAHKKTLDSWQKLYEESMEECLPKKGKKTVSKQMLSSSSCGQYPVHKVDIKYNEQDPVEDLHCGSDVTVDTRSSFSWKNPAPRRPKTCVNNTTVKKDDEKNSASEKDNNCSQHPRYCYQNMEEDSWKDLMTPTRSLHEETRISGSLTPTNNMKTHLSDRSLSDPFSDVNRELFEKYGYNNNGADDDNSWHHRLTIPEPFNMTKREENGQTKKKSRTLLEYEKECEEKRKFVEEECSKMFKASPVPGHVFLPLYEEIRRKDELRRSMVKEQSKEFLQSQERPFSFTLKDNEKDECEEEQCHKIQWEQDENRPFKANPVPKHILDSSIDEKLKDDANMREVKKKIRSYELLKNSSIPQGMEFRQKLMEQKLKSKARETEKKHNPKIHYTVPDYNALYKQFQKDLMKKRKVKENTNVQPFTFRTSELIKQRERKKNESEDLQDSNNIGTGRLRRSNSLPDHLHSIPAKTTTSTELRMRANKEKITKLKSNAASTDKIPKPKDNFLKKEIQLKISANDKKSKNTKSTPKYWEQQKNYSRQLRDMRERLEKRPLLFEQVEKNNAKNRAEKKFKQTLKDCGLDENFVTEKLLSPKNRRPSFPRPRSADCYRESQGLSVLGENWEKIKSHSGESDSIKDSFQNHSSKSSHSDDNSPYSPDSSSEDTDNGQESTRSEF